AGARPRPRTEWRRSRTDRAVGYTTAAVLKTAWATGPMPLRGERSEPFQRLDGLPAYHSSTLRQTASSPTYPCRGRCGRLGRGPRRYARLSLHLGRDLVGRRDGHDGRVRRCDPTSVDGGIVGMVVMLVGIAVAHRTEMACEAGRAARGRPFRTNRTLVELLRRHGQVRRVEVLVVQRCTARVLAAADGRRHPRADEEVRAAR